MESTAEGGKKRGEFLLSLMNHSPQREKELIVEEEKGHLFLPFPVTQRETTHGNLIRIYTQISRGEPNALPT